MSKSKFNSEVVYFYFSGQDFEYLLLKIITRVENNPLSVKWPYASECGLQLTAKVLRHANRLDPHINRMHAAEEAFYQIGIQ